MFVAEIQVGNVKNLHLCMYMQIHKLFLGGPYFVAGGDGVTPGQNYEQIGVVSQAFSECRDGNVYAKYVSVVSRTNHG